MVCFLKGLQSSKDPVSLGEAEIPIPQTLRQSSSLMCWDSHLEQPWRRTEELAFSTSSKQIKDLLQTIVDSQDNLAWGENQLHWSTVVVSASLGTCWDKKQNNCTYKKLHVIRYSIWLSNTKYNFLL